MKFIQRLVVLVGTPGSGKDILIRAVNDLGAHHAQIVPKHTTREKWIDDREELIFPDDPEFNLGACDIVYKNYGNTYGIESACIWDGLCKGAFQVVVVSDVVAINRLHEIFGDLVLLVYVHSEIGADMYLQLEEKQGKIGEYLEQRVRNYDLAYKIYLENFLTFDHVLIYSGVEKDVPFGVDEDLYDQIFRLFRSYERGDIHYSSPKPSMPRFWQKVEIQTSAKILDGDTD